MGIDDIVKLEGGPEGSAVAEIREAALASVTERIHAAGEEYQKAYDLPESYARVLAFRMFAIGQQVGVGEIARACDISERHVYNITRDPRWQAALAEESTQILGNARPEVAQTVRDMALERRSDVLVPLAKSLGLLRDQPDVAVNVQVAQISGPTLDIGSILERIGLPQD